MSMTPPGTNSIVLSAPALVVVGIVFATVTDIFSFSQQYKDNTCAYGSHDNNTALS